MSFAVLGFPAGEAVTPFAAITLAATLGWREAWLVAAAVLTFVSIPLVLFFLRREPAIGSVQPGPESSIVARKEWTWAEVIRRPEFFALVSGILVPSFAMTGIFFTRHIWWK